MCMIFTKNDIIKINRNIENKGYKVINKSSLEFSLSAANKSKDWITQLAYLLRAIVVDHAFEEGNKRTAAAVFLGFCNGHKKRYDLYKVEKIIGSMSLGKTKDIEKIREMIKDATE
mgnify:CR=1 FL=1